MALAFVLSSTPVLAQATRPGATDFSATRQLILTSMARDSLPGLAIAVARGDSILWEEGFGWANREMRVPATPNTPFYLASVTKTIVATAAMMLRERGQLDLDKPANDYLGAPQLWSPAWDTRGATVRRLINHTSGLTTFDLGCAAVQPQCHAPSSGEIISRYGVLVWPPGEQFDYSNLGYYVLGEVVAHAAGQDLGTVLREQLFQPLGMMRSSLGVDAALERETAFQYSWTRGRLARPTTAPSGASSGYASAHDLMLFGAMHTRGRKQTARSILSDAAIDTMQYAVVPAGSSLYGLGWWVEENRFGYRSILAQGGTDASSTWLRIIPSERITIVVLANKGVGFSSDVIDAALSALLPHYAELLAQRAQPASTAAVAPASTHLDSAFVGTWRGIIRAESGDVPLEVTVDDSGATRATLGSRASEALGKARVSGGQFRLNFPGDLETADASSGAQLAFYLRPRSGVLNGTATTRPRVASGLDGRVSYWVELRKNH